MWLVVAFPQQRSIISICTLGAGRVAALLDALICCDAVQRIAGREAGAQCDDVAFEGSLEVVAQIGAVDDAWDRDSFTTTCAEVLRVFVLCEG